MADPVRIFALTGDAVARFRLDGSEPELGLEGSQRAASRWIPAIHDACMSGRWTAACGSASTAVLAGARPARQSTSPEFSRSPFLGQISTPASRSSRQAPSRATSIAPRTAGSAGNRCRLCGSCRVRRAGRCRRGLRRMPYALLTLPDQPGRLLVGLGGGTLLITDDAARAGHGCRCDCLT